VCWDTSTHGSEGERRSNPPDLPDAIALIRSLLRVVGDVACNQQKLRNNNITKYVLEEK